MRLLSSLSAVLLTLMLAWQSPSLAMEPFVIDDIRVEGLQRISVGTVFNYLPLERGGRVDAEAASAAVRALFKTGFFEDVVLEREAESLVVFVAERPAIASVEIEGNSDIPSDQLEANLKLLGLSEGKMFNRSLLDKVKTELQRQYLALGKYNAKVRTEVKRRERNRVAIRIEIAEGDEAAIHHINIIGNRAYSEKELLEKLILSSDGGLFGGADKYSRQKLTADLETLRDHYLNNGYVNFQVVSTQVTITPDKQDVYVTISVDEGKQYTISEITVSGNTIVPKDQLYPLITLGKGDVFSRKEILEAGNRITSVLGDNGYAFSNINPVPDRDDEKLEIAVNYYVDAGDRMYIRRINISGNAQTNDEVLRREIRQMEGGWYSTTKVERSKTRLNRLGFFNEVNISTKPVVENNNQVDLDVKVVEQESFGSFNFGIGYGDTQGFTVNTSIDWQNFRGTGKRLSLNFDNSDVNTVYSIQYVEPYYTVDGVSRSMKAFYRTSDSSEANTTSYTTDSYGFGLGFGVPVSEYDTVRYRINYEHMLLHTSSSTAQDTLDFCSDVAQELDCEFGTYKLGMGWSRDTRDRAVFPTEGGELGLNAEVALGGSEDLGEEFLNAPQFYKLRLNKEHYIKLTDWLTFAVDGEISYADSYGGSSILPPYERYYAGGVRTVRGYETNRLYSTADTLDEYGLPSGGAVRILGGLELLMPPPFNLESKSMRFSAFVDMGNVYNSLDDLDVVADELRMTYGISMNWLTPVGPMVFSLGWPINAKEGDRLESFQFSLGMI